MVGPLRARTVRWIAVLLILPLFAFSVLGFLATFEPMPAKTAWLWRAAWSGLGLACLLSLARHLRRLRGK